MLSLWVLQWITHPGVVFTTSVTSGQLTNIILDETRSGAQCSFLGYVLCSQWVGNPSWSFRSRMLFILNLTCKFWVLCLWMATGRLGRPGKITFHNLNPILALRCNSLSHPPKFYSDGQCKWLGNTVSFDVCSQQQLFSVGGRYMHYWWSAAIPSWTLVMSLLFLPLHLKCCTWIQRSEIVLVDSEIDNEKDLITLRLKRQEGSLFPGRCFLS